MRAIPPVHLFLETDDDPLPIEAVYAEAAALLGVAEADLCEAIYLNYKRLFEQKKQATT